MKEFPPFQLDNVNQSLWRHTDVAECEAVVLTPKAFGVLRYLVEHAGRLVTHNELLESLWPNTYVQPEVLKNHNRNQQHRVSPGALLSQWLLVVETLLQELQEFLNCDESSGLASVDFFDATLKLTGNWCSFCRQAKNKCAFHTS